MKLVGKKLGYFRLTDAIMIGVAKTISERLLTSFVGNGTVNSGALKIGIGYMLPAVLPREASKIVATALAIDGVEDIITQFSGASASGGVI